MVQLLPATPLHVAHMKKSAETCTGVDKSPSTFLVPISELRRDWEGFLPHLCRTKDFHANEKVDALATCF